VDGISSLDVLLRLVVAAGACGVIGLEREAHGSPAGLRTHMLVGLGAALFTMVGAYSIGNTDPTRIAAQVVTGIGFIGAGAIIYMQGSVRGLTTAASLWLTAAIGVGAALGAYEPLAVALFLGLFGLWPLRLIERRFFHTRRELLEISTTLVVTPADLLDLLGPWSPREVSFREQGERRQVEVSVRSGRRTEAELTRRLAGHEGIVGVRRGREGDGES
jgi:uncharacterized membrane protein YhiD involved in acid resistance